jgi:hypothetical protein
MGSPVMCRGTELATRAEATVLLLAGGGIERRYTFWPNSPTPSTPNSVLTPPSVTGIAVAADPDGSAHEAASAAAREPPRIGWLGGALAGTDPGAANAMEPEAAELKTDTPAGNDPATRGASGTKIGTPFSDIIVAARFAPLLGCWRAR